MSAFDIAPANQAWARHPAWALLLCGAPLLVGARAGALFIDDAFITFRYAENLIHGNGFVYNSIPVLGTTAPFYGLLLALARLVGVSMPTAAWTIGVGSAAAAPALVWRLGTTARRPVAGLIGGAILALFPTWWQNSVSGMETTLAGALAVAVVLLDLKNKPIAAGALAGLLALTRPDAALLPAIVFALNVRRDRRAGAAFALAGAAILGPWLLFSTIYFGSPLPHSLAAKGLIHAYPFHLALGRYLGWFFALTAPPGLALMSVAWVAGAAAIIRNQRDLLAVALWPPVFLLGLALTRVGPFFWYKVPVLPLYFFGAGLGCAILYSFADEPGRFGDSTRTVLKIVVGAAPAIFMVLQLAIAAPVLLDRDLLRAQVEKEDILAAQAAVIKDHIQRSGRRLSDVTVYAGEVGVIGYDLLDADIIDSAGINSPEVLELRRLDWERLSGDHPDYGWREQWQGSAAWSREVIERNRPDYIQSNIDYCHLRTLVLEPWFGAGYDLIDERQDRTGQTFALWARKPPTGLDREGK